MEDIVESSAYSDILRIQDDRERSIALRIYNSASNTLGFQHKATLKGMIAVLVTFGLTAPLILELGYYPVGEFWRSENGPLAFLAIVMAFSFAVGWLVSSLFWSFKYKKCRIEATKKFADLLVAYGDEARRPIEFINAANPWLWDRIMFLVKEIEPKS